MTDDDIELPEDIQELVDTYGDNCREIENQALDMVCSVEIPMFSLLRDLNAQKCLSILARIRDWFGSTPGQEHYLCLMIVTDYISCAYNNTDFYGTFNKEKKDKFYDSFFTRLWKEWKNVFNRMPMSVLPSLRHFEMLKNSLHASIARFPNTFLFRWVLNDIKNSCDEYGLKLKKHLSDLKASQNSKLKANFFVKSSLPVSSSNCSTVVVPVANVSKPASVIIPGKNNQSSIVPNAVVVPAKNVQSPIVLKGIPIPSENVKSPIVLKGIPIPSENIKSPIVLKGIPIPAENVKSPIVLKGIPIPSENVKSPIVLKGIPIPSENLKSPIVLKGVPIPSKIVQTPPASKAIPVPYKHVQTPFVSKALSEAKKATAPPDVIVIDDSPVKMDRTQQTLSNITNMPIERPSAETYEVLKPLNSEVKRMKFQNGVVVSEPQTKNSLPRKLNAFDILMRKKVIKTVS